MRTRRQQNYWPSDKEFLEQIIDNPARTNEPKKRWEATLIVGILIIFSKIIFCYCRCETTIEYLKWGFCLLFFTTCRECYFFSWSVPLGFHELFLESIKIKENFLWGDMYIWDFLFRSCSKNKVCSSHETFVLFKL